MSDSRAVMTSATHPLRVDWIVRDLPGAVGLTLAPGKHAPSLEGGSWRRDLQADLDRLVADGVGLLVCLLEDHELERLGLGGYLEAAAARGLEVLRLPIADGGVPDDPDALRLLVEDVVAAARAGHRVVVHCAGGLGRAGLVGGCVLRALGASADEALDTLRRARSPRCPETEAQRAVVRAFAASAPGAPTRRERLLGAVLGAAVGDAMGHPTEFMGMQAIHARFGPRGVQGFELWWTRGGQRFAPYTDDTQLAEVVLRALCDAQEAGEDLDAAMRRMAEGFVAWARDPQGGHRAPGRACLAGCRALSEGVPWDRAGAPDAGGCGSVMRAYPFGLLFAEDEARAEAWAVAHSKPTHGDPIALAACAAMAVGVARSVRGVGVAETVGAMVDAARRYSPRVAAMMRRAWDEARAGVGPEVTLDRLRAWGAHEAIAAAVYLLARHPDDARAAILEGANTPGDSDSIATLAGALVGARVGVRGLPADWVRDVERSSELAALADRAHAVATGTRVTT